MRQVSLIALVSVLTLLMGGCFGGDEGGETGTSNPSPTPVAVQPRPKPAPFANPPLTPKNIRPGTTSTAAGLIQSPPPEAVVKQINKGRADPFAAVPVQPEVTVSPNPGGGGGTSTSPVPVVPPLPSTASPRTNGGSSPARQRVPGGNVLPPPPQVSSKPKVSVPARPSSSSRPGSSSRPVGLPPVVATAPRFIPQLPKLPEPTLAKGVQVTGVVEVGGESRAIVKVANEPERTVREGDRLLNGQVLVKRIETRGSTPLVILEQYGVEVARRIGEAPAGGAGAPTAEPGAPAASLPTTPSGNAKGFLTRDIYV